jgi:FixJ family two-component response regulator
VHIISKRDHELAAQKETDLSAHPMISVVDDDASIRVALDDLLQSLGYAVLTFESAEEFLRSGYLDDTGCVISDVNMPMMSGVELLGLIRGRGIQVPFILITAFPQESIAKQALRAGAACCLTKPFRRDDLVQCVESAFRTSGHAGPDA